MPTGYLIAGSGVWTGFFALGVLHLTVVAGVEEGRIPPDAGWGLPFFAGSCVAIALMLYGQLTGQFRIALRGVRAACFVIFLSIVLLLGGTGYAWMRSDEDTGWVFAIVLFSILAGLVGISLLGPLGLMERRLRARQIAGHPEWRPSQAGNGQRSDAVLAFSAALGGFSATILGAEQALMNVSWSDPDSLREIGVFAFMGLFGGYVLGCVLGVFLSFALNDRDLSKVLPPVVLVTPIAGVAGGLLGVGWGVVAIGTSMFATAMIFRAKHKLRDASECEKCGYSLVGLDSAICPECGYTTMLGNRAQP